MTITGFINARLDEVQDAASRVLDDPGPTISDMSAVDVEELKLVRVEVVRAVVAEHECDSFSQICLTCRHRDSDDGWASEAWPCPTIRQLALLWAEHPSYDATWSPSARPTRNGHAAPRRRTSSGTWLLDTSARRSAPRRPYTREWIDDHPFDGGKPPGRS